MGLSEDGAEEGWTAWGRTLEKQLEPRREKPEIRGRHFLGLESSESSEGEGSAESGPRAAACSAPPLSLLAMFQEALGMKTQRAGGQEQCLSLVITFCGLGRRGRDQHQEP